MHNGKSYKTVNAIKQNDIHIKLIEEILQTPIPIISLIIYSNRTETININCKPGHVAITRHAELYDTLDKINKILEVKISDENKQKLYKKLKEHKTNKINDQKEFNKYVKSKENSVKK
jgi:hypothetical protein